MVIGTEDVSVEDRLRGDVVLFKNIQRRYACVAQSVKPPALDLAQVVISVW